MPSKPAFGDRAGKSGAVLVRRTALFEERSIETSSMKMRSSWTASIRLTISTILRAATSESAKRLGSTNLMARVSSRWSGQKHQTAVLYLPAIFYTQWTLMDAIWGHPLRGFNARWRNLSNPRSRRLRNPPFDAACETPAKADFAAWKNQAADDARYCWQADWAISRSEVHQ
jgi:hypothetical protein